MRNLLMTSFFAAAAGLGCAALSSLPVQAQNLQLELGADGPKLKLRDDDCNPKYQDCEGRGPMRRYNDRYNDQYNDQAVNGMVQQYRRAERGCTEDRALDKADRMGIHRARVQYAGRRTIKVRGMQYGDRVQVTFGRDRGCPILDRG